MERKLALLLILGMVTLASCGLREKHVQKLVALIPNDQLRSILKAVVHKVAKTQFGCPAYEGYCNDHCNDIERKDGECHGFKCKCAKD
uniref:Potassium channel toxin TsTXK-beta/Cryptide TyPep-16 n=3 Tax=Tityus TaxID=6886 RepID=KBX1_TITSE|nr:RecName: Full=Potassium channel toxin TsTXK-beta; Short=TsTXKbeta; AltName: Full=Potassium channel toxin beta-KTx 1; AltName: Full=Tityustoxin K-beta; Short=TsTX K beta; Short=TsTX-K beta; AltName: Full=Tityustoxin-8; Short=Ts8; AltName: Full=TsK2; Flags: Precursor [Tityus serrulatus]QPD99047.1 potassium channel toxin Ts8 [Tityus serrulatus]